MWLIFVQYYEIPAIFARKGNYYQQSAICEKILYSSAGGGGFRMVLTNR